MPPLDPATTPPAQWRSLDALADTPEFRRFVAREFPAVTDLCAGPERRQFLRLMAASFAMAGLAGCDEAPDKRDQEVPYVRNPERMQPGIPLHYASSVLIDGFANGAVVTTRDGRPLKIEGNAQHPWSRGGTDVSGQASVLDLYDPAKSQTVRQLDRASTWAAFRGATTGPLAAMRASGGAGLRLLTAPITSPLLQAQVAAMRAAYKGMHWHTYAPIDRAAVYEGTRRAFGRALEPRWRFGSARVVVALDGDFLDAGPQQVGVAAEWSAARKVSVSAGHPLVLYAAGPVPNLTLAKADHPIAARQSDLAGLARALLADVSAPTASSSAAADATPLDAWRVRAAAALRAARGAGIVIAGSAQPPEVHEWVHRLNAALGNHDHTVFYTQPVPQMGETIASLVAAMQAGQVQTLVMLGVNPAYDAPGSLGFVPSLARVPMKIHAGQTVDETGQRADWHLPLLHPLESWGDARSFDGTIGLLQPTIAPLYQGRSLAEIVSLLTDGQEQAGRDLLRRHHQGSTDAKTFEPQWEAMLKAGFVADSAFEPETVTLTAAPPASNAPPPTFEILFRPDPVLRAGEWADNGWLQELPKPLTKLVWQNAITVGPAFAAREKLAHGDVIRIGAGARAVEGPVWIMPGQADHTIGLTLGYGRSVAGRLSDAIGYDAYRLQDAASPWGIGGVAWTRTGQTQRFTTTQDHNTMEGHDFVRVQQPGAPAAADPLPKPTLYPAKEGDGRAWGMVIDLDACIGCNACVTACQAENNIAVVGREQVALGREMHWLRVDRYYEGPPEAPVTHFQPVPCMHCEDAPCEVGCPVEATLHDSEGLNVMVYNRCVGTRACSGYCPYKVRHFNYLDYSAGAAPSVDLQRNPEVTVRARGVMEKCTYCVQRIVDARITSDKTLHPILDGAVQTACQSACPTRAIHFGDLNDRTSDVLKARHDPRNYALLGELGVRPRTTYLTKMAPKTAPLGEDG